MRARTPARPGPRAGAAAARYGDKHCARPPRHLPLSSHPSLNWVSLGVFKWEKPFFHVPSSHLCVARGHQPSPPGTPHHFCTKLDSLAVSSLLSLQRHAPGWEGPCTPPPAPHRGPDPLPTKPTTPQVWYKPFIFPPALPSRTQAPQEAWGRVCSLEPKPMRDGCSPATVSPPRTGHGGEPRGRDNDTDCTELYTELSGHKATPRRVPQKRTRAPPPAAPPPSPHPQNPDMLHV